MLIKHYILEHELKSVPSIFGKVLLCPYCKEQFPFQNLSRHCHRKHKSEIQRDRSLLTNCDASISKGKRRSAVETNKKIVDSTKMDDLVNREIDAVRKAESRSKETSEESKDRKDAANISKIIKKVIDFDEDKKTEEQRKDSERKAKERSQESDKTKAKRIASIGARSKLKRSKESEEQKQKRLKAAAGHVMKHRNNMTEQRKNEILEERRKQYRGGDSSSDDSQDDKDPDLGISDRVTKSSSYESMLKYFFKLGQGSMYFKPISSIQNDLLLDITYGQSWTGAKAVSSSLQIGSYKVNTNEPIYFTSQAIFFRAPMVTYVRNMRTLILLPKHLEDITMCLESDPTLLFITPNANVCKIICKDLNLKSDAKRIFLDKNASDHTMKCICMAIPNVPITLIEILYEYYGSVVKEISPQEARHLMEKCSQTNVQAKFQKSLNKCLLLEEDESDSDFASKLSFQLLLAKPILKIRMGETSGKIQALQKVYRKCLAEEGIHAIYSEISIGTFNWNNETLGRHEYPQNKVFFKRDVIYFNSPYLTNPSMFCTIFLLPSDVTKIEIYVKEKLNDESANWDEDYLPRSWEEDIAFVFFTLTQNACRRIREDLHMNAKFLGIHFDSCSVDDISYTKIGMKFQQRFQDCQGSSRFILKFLQANYPKVTFVLSEIDADKKIQDHLNSAKYNNLKMLQNHKLGSGSIKHTKIEGLYQEIFGTEFQSDLVNSMCIGSYAMHCSIRLYMNKETFYFVAPMITDTSKGFAIFVPFEEISSADTYETDVYGRSMAYLFLKLNTSACERICNDLNLNFKSKRIFFNSCANDVTMQRITMCFSNTKVKEAFSSISKHLSSKTKVNQMDDLTGWKSIHSYAPGHCQNYNRLMLDKCPVEYFEKPHCEKTCYRHYPNVRIQDHPLNSTKPSINSPPTGNWKDSQCKSHCNHNHVTWDVLCPLCKDSVGHYTYPTTHLYHFLRFHQGYVPVLFAVKFLKCISCPAYECDWKGHFTKLEHHMKHCDIVQWTFDFPIKITLVSACYERNEKGMSFHEQEQCQCPTDDVCNLIDPEKVNSFTKVCDELDKLFPNCNNVYEKVSYAKNLIGNYKSKKDITGMELFKKAYQMIKVSHCPENSLNTSFESLEIKTSHEGL